MKNFSKLNKAKVALCIAIVSTSLTSCYKDYIGKGNGNNNLQVETLTNELEGARIDAITVDKKGNIYASQFGQFSGGNGDGSTIFKITKDGTTKEYINELSGPLGNAIDSQGNFYVVHNNNNGSGEILKITPNGTKTLLATLDGFLTGLTLDKHNNLYVANFSTPTIHQISPRGEIKIYASDDRLPGVVGIDFDRNGNLIAGNYATADVLSINTKGEVTLITNIPDIVVNGAGIGYLTVAHNSIFATGINVHKIFRITMDGDISHFAGSGEIGDVDGNLLEATFNRPNGITYDKYYKILYVSEYSSTAIRKIKLY